MQHEYEGKRIVVTGGSSGLGLATAELLVSRGARVAICGRNPERLDGAARTLGAHAPEDRVLARSVDVTAPGALESLLDEVDETWGGLDGLVNSAGVHTGGSFMETSDEQWQDDFNLKLLAAVRGIRLAAPLMARGGGGSVVNVLSVFARFQPAGSMPSSVFRAAGLALTNGAAAELAPSGVRVNGALIGFVHSDQWVRASAEQGITLAEFERRTVDHWKVPMDRAGESVEAAEAIAFLLSDRASYLTGTSLNVDGGMSPAI